MFVRKITIFNKKMENALVKNVYWLHSMAYNSNKSFILHFGLRFGVWAYMSDFIFMVFYGFSELGSGSLEQIFAVER